MRGIRIQDPGEVEEGIAAAFAHDGRSLGSELRALLDVGTNNQDWACLDDASRPMSSSPATGPTERWTKAG